MFRVEHLAMFLYRNLFGSRACLVMLLTYTRNKLLTAKLLNQGYR